MDIVLITRDRPELTEQTIRSMIANAADWSKHRLMVVIDGGEEIRLWEGPIPVDITGPNIRYWETGKQLGVGGAKNFGAEWISRNQRRAVEPPALLMFSDNDMWYGPGWDERLEGAMLSKPAFSFLSRSTVTQLGGWRHPYHQLGNYVTNIIDRYTNSEMAIFEVDAVPGNCFVIRWSDWLKYGPFDANAIGPGQSEDFALSQRIKAAGGIVATLDPPVAIHCGLVNSSGEPATGWREMEQQITEQLAALPEAMRNEVLIMRPVIDTAHPLQGLRVTEQTLPPRGMRMEPTQVLHPGVVVASKYAPGGRPQPQYEPQYRCATCDTPMYWSGEPGCVHVCLNCHPDQSPMGMKQSKQDQLQTIADQVVEESRRRVIARLQQMRERGLTIDQQKLEEGAERLNEAAVEMGLMERKPDPRSPDFQYRISERAIGLNCGSGQRRFEAVPDVAWVNIDSQSVPPDRVADIVCDIGKQPIPFPSASVQYVVLHQVLEHFGCGESEPMLRECWRVLRPSGSLIITVPDMRKLAARWLGGEMDDQLFMTNVYGAYMGDEADRHKWGFSAGSLFTYLHSVLPTDAEPRIFDWREIPGASLARDWWVAAAEFVKP